MMVRLRLRTVRKSVVSIAVVFGITCIFLYMHAGYRETKLSGVPQPPIPQFLSKSSISPKQQRQQQIMMDTVFAELKFDNQPGGVWKQGFPITYNMSDWEQEPLEVFLVPHSHQDPGWIFTIDEYFEKMTRAGLYATTTILERNPDARFIYAEMSFFSKWVNLLDDHGKQLVHKLLHDGQLEIASGGWVMTDEATASYYAMVDQMIEGHHWLWDNFAYRPNMSWSIDPFGQSTTMAYLVRKFGFHAMVIGRVHYEVKKYLAMRRALEFHWRQQWDSATQPQIPCHMLAFYSYDIPHTCGPDPSVCCQFDFLRLNKPRCPWPAQPKRITPSNVAERAQLLIDQYRKKSMLYNPRGVLLVPLGDDFRFLSVHEWELQLENYKQIIQYLDKHPEHRVKLRFATLSEYFNAFYRRYGQNPRAALSTNTANAQSPRNLDLPTFTGDLFTYADRDHDYWSGYFTSRPVQKLITRVLESELRSTEILYAYAQHTMMSAFEEDTLSSTVRILYDRLTAARRSLGLFQHHDAVTGTAKPHVVADYSRQLLEALSHCRFVSSVSAAALLLIPREPGLGIITRSTEIVNMINDLVSALQMQQELVALESLEDIHVEDGPPIPYEIRMQSATLPIPIVMFNPLPQPRTTIITLELNGLHQSLTASLPDPPDSLIHRARPVPRKPPLIQMEVPKTETGGTVRVRLGPIHLAPLSMTTMVLQKTNGTDQGKPLVYQKPPSSSKDSVFWLTIERIELGFDSQTGFLKYLVDTRLRLTLAISVDFLVYRTDNRKKSKSGAYIFVPSSPPEVMKLPENPVIQVLRGPLVQEVTVSTPYVNHTVRLHRYPSFPSQVVEIENTVDLNHVDPQNIELVMRIRTNVSNSAREFYTDSNCLQFVRRQYYDKIPLQGNLYPMTCAVFIESKADATRNSLFPRLNLFSTYSHGVTSPSEGDLYVWLDRRTAADDDRGLRAPLAGRWIAQSTFRLFAELVQPGSLSQPGGVPVLTGRANAVLTDLLRPVQRFIMNHQISSQASPVVQLMPHFEMPTDYELVALKTFHHPDRLFKPFTDSNGAQIGIILHRLANPPLPPPPINDDGEEEDLANLTPHPSSLEIPISRMFSQLERTRAVQTPLTMIPANASAPDFLSTVTLNSMELDAFLLAV